LSLGFNLTNTPLGMDWTYGDVGLINCSILKNNYPSFGEEEEDCTVFLAIIMEHPYDEIANDILGGVELMYNNGSLVELDEDYGDPTGTIDGQFIFFYMLCFVPPEFRHNEFIFECGCDSYGCRLSTKQDTTCQTCPTGTYSDTNSTGSCKTKTKCGLGQGDEMGFNLTYTERRPLVEFGYTIEEYCNLVKPANPSFQVEDCEVFMTIFSEYSYLRTIDDLLGLSYINNGVQINFTIYGEESVNIEEGLGVLEPILGCFLPPENRIIDPGKTNFICSCDSYGCRLSTKQDTTCQTCPIGPYSDTSSTGSCQACPSGQVPSVGHTGCIEQPKKSEDEELPDWAWILIGLGAGIIVIVGIVLVYKHKSNVPKNEVKVAVRSLIF
jgi:hypothetical protein